MTDPETLVGVATDLVARRGVAGTRLGDVAAAAGVAVGTVYAHFPSKDHLLDAVAQRLEARFVEVMTAAAPDRAPLRDVVPQLVTAVLDLAAGTAALRVMSERSDGRHVPEGEAPVLRGWIARRVARAQRSGEVAAVDAELVADLGFALLRAAMTRGATGAAADDRTRHEAEPLLVAALLALLPPPGPGKVVDRART